MLRVPPGLSDAMERDPAGLAMAARETLFAAPHKLDRLCEFHVGQVITGLGRGSLLVGGRMVLLYCTVSGTVGAFTPMQHRSTGIALQGLEAAIRDLCHDSDTLPLISLTGRHQLLLSTAGQPVRAVIDGDLCHAGLDCHYLPPDLSGRVCAAIDREPMEVSRMLCDSY